MTRDELNTLTFQSTLPARGATRPSAQRAASSIVFQSTLPARGATQDAKKWAQIISQFQSTLPARGATPLRLATLATPSNFNPRSPHGERRCLCNLRIAIVKFQSTLPARGATPRRGRTRRRNGISIHAPRTGSDACRGLRCPCSIISIHAPRTGSDPARWRTSCGARRFQSTLPARGATTFRRGAAQPSASISIHAPRTGSDHAGGTKACAGCEISIHAPRTGSDPIKQRTDLGARYFNPRSPHGERLTSFKILLMYHRFQSTLPARGATLAI